MRGNPIVQFAKGALVHFANPNAFSAPCGYDWRLDGGNASSNGGHVTCEGCLTVIWEEVQKIFERCEKTK